MSKGHLTYTLSLMNRLLTGDCSHQHPPGRNQKQRIQALEAALGQLEPADPILASPPTSNAAETTFDLAPVSPPSSGPQNPSPCDDQSLWAFDPSWKRTHQQASPEIIGEQGRTALHLAVSTGNESITRLLLERGADITKQDHNGATALHLACERGSEVLTRLLLEKLADPNERDFLGRTALFRAVAEKNETVVKLLLEASADVNAKDSLGTMALHLAVESGSEPLVLLLLQHGADIDA